MPAVTADPRTLTRLSGATEADVERKAIAVTTAPSGFEGEGFPVKRSFAGVTAAALDPFIHMDQMGAVEYQPGDARGTDWHPHRGFETVTYLLDGRFQHQDSHGGGGLIVDGATQWMTAGSGILHIETPPVDLVDAGGLFHGIQLWVNLPSKDKFLAPKYQGIEADQISLFASQDASSLLRVIAGEVDGHSGPGSTHTPIFMGHATVNPGERISIPWRDDFNALVYALSGRGTVGPDNRPLEGGQLAVLGEGNRVTLTADRTQDSNAPTFEVLLLGGRPIGEPVVHYGPFVMNTREEIAQALHDYQTGRLGTIPADGIRPYHGTR